MPYLSRATDGSIASLHSKAADDAVEFLNDQHPEVRAFIGLDADGFAALDADFIRVLEDRPFKRPLTSSWHRQQAHCWPSA